MHFFAILRSLHSHSKASLLLWLLLWVCVCGRKKIRLMACVYVSLYVHAVLFIDRLVLWSQCMALFFNPYFSFVFFTRKREKNQPNHLPMCCVVSVFAPFTHSVDQPSQIVSLLPLLLFPACPFFTQHNAHTFVSTVLRGSFAHKLHAHDLYKLNAAILLNAYACFRFYFLCAALIAFFSLQFIITHSSCTVFSLWSMFRGNNFCSLCFCCGDYCYCKRDFYSKLFLWCTRFFAIFASISAVYTVYSYDFIFFRTVRNDTM